MLKVKTPLAILLAFYCAAIHGQTFIKVTDPLNPINSANMAGFYRGAAWVDFDADGDLDLSTLPFFFRNEGNDNFVRITAGQTTDQIGSVSWGDVDDDGDPDCLYGSIARGTFILYNQGDGQFSPAPLDAGNPLRCWSAQLGEFNNDGNLDAIITVADGFGGLTSPNFFYIGSGGGAFSPLNTFEFTQNTAPYTVSYWTDFDNDGDSDLFIAAGPAGTGAPDYHYRNLLRETGTAQLQRIQDLPFGMDNQDGQCYNFIDYDLDNDLDLFVTNYSGVKNRFYENNGAGWAEVNNQLTFQAPNLGNTWGDFDLDGDEDVVITSDALTVAGYYKNNGDGTFTKTGSLFADFTANVSGCTIGDYDNDGDLDLFALGGATSVGAKSDRGLYKNELANGNHWLQVSLTGTNSNTTGVGAVVWLEAKIQGTDRRLRREVSAQNSFMGHNAQRLHFGLGDAATVDLIEVLWPSGRHETFQVTGIDKRINLWEGSGTSLSGVTRPSLLMELPFFPNPVSGDELFWEIPNGFETRFEQLIVVDMLGRTIIHKQLSGEFLDRLNVSGLLPGQYQLTLIHKDINWTAKFQRI